MNKYLFSLLIASFLMPFVPPGCIDMRATGPKREIPTDSLSVDTVAITQKTDTNTNANDTTIATVPIPTDTSTYRSEDSLSLVSRIFISPDKKNLSGIGYLVTYFELEYVLVFVSFFIPMLLFGLSIFKVNMFTIKDRYILCLGMFCSIIIALLHYDVLVWGYWIHLLIYFFTTLVAFLQKDK